MSSALLIIARRELRSALSIPETWVTMGIAWFLAGLFAWHGVVPATGSNGDLPTVIINLAVAWLVLQIIVAPLLAMRLLAEEKRSGTFEGLMTAPVQDHQVVLGKFLAVNVVHMAGALVVPLLALLVVPFVERGGAIDAGQLFAAWFALVGTGALFLAAGVFASAIATHQVVAGLVAFALEVLLLFGPVMAVQNLPPEHPLSAALAHGQLFRHVAEAGAGIIDANHVTYHVAFAAFFLLLAVRALEVRKWK